jgi:hypothetical protein
MAVLESLVWLGRISQGLIRRSGIFIGERHLISLVSMFSFLHSGAIKDGVKACGTAYYVFACSRTL